MKRLFLEERISIVRNALNTRTLEFQDLLPASHRVAFHQFVLDCMNALDGFSDVVERLQKSGAKS